MNLKNILVGSLLGSAILAGGVYVGDTQRAKIDAQNAQIVQDTRRLQEAINGQKDVAVMAIRWCGHLEMVAFFKANGDSEGIIISANTESRLNGIVARAKLLPQKHVYTAQIARNCGNGT